MDKQKAFTLVELIVIVTILAILAILGYVSFGKYAINSKDSARISDVNLLSKALTSHIIVYGSYPQPTGGNVISISHDTGSSQKTLWNQGSVNRDLVLNLRGIIDKPIDPLTQKEYVYSVTNNGQEFQIAAALELGKIAGSNPLVSQAYAIGRQALVKGNYNGAILGTQIDNTVYIFSVPSIIVQDMSDTTIADVMNNDNFVVSGFSAIPGALKTVPSQENGKLGLPSTGYILYSGTRENMLGDIELQNTANAIKDYYTGSTINSIPNIEIFTDNTLTGSELSDFFRSTLLANKTIGPIIKYNNF